MDPVAQELHHLAQEVYALTQQLRADAHERRTTAPVRIEICLTDSRQQDRILQLLTQLQTTIMKTLDEVLTSVQENTTLTTSLITFTKGIEQQLKDALAGVTLPAATQEKVDAVFDAIEANKANVSAALVANTPQQPEPGEPVA